MVNFTRKDFLAIAVLTLLSLPQATLAHEACGDAAAGKQKSKTELCQECHGEDGNSTSMSTPKLAGQASAYIVKQLRDFQSGARVHRVMTEMAHDLSETDRRDIAAYFSSQQRSHESDKSFSLSGRDLFVNGDVDRGVQQCINCHGDKGQGTSARGVSYPALGGQHRTYLRIQLIRWRLGERQNSSDGVMNRIAQALSDDDLDALTSYLSGL